MEKGIIKFLTWKLINSSKPALVGFG